MLNLVNLLRGSRLSTTTDESLLAVHDISDEESVHHDQHHPRVQSHSDSAPENDSSPHMHDARHPRDSLSHNDPFDDTNPGTTTDGNPEESHSRPSRHGHGQNHRHSTKPTQHDHRSNRSSRVSPRMSASDAEKKIQELIERQETERRHRKHDERELKAQIEVKSRELKEYARSIEKLERQLARGDQALNKLQNERNHMESKVVHYHDRAENYRKEVEHAKVQNRELQGLLHSTKTQLEGTQQSRKELEDLLETKTAELQSSMAFLRKDDTISGADVTRKVKDLNEEIAAFTAQIGVFEEEMFEEMTQKDVGVRDGKELDVFITGLFGQDVVQYLYSTKGEEETELAAQCALQALLIDACVRLISSWTLQTSIDAILKGMYARLLQTEIQTISGRWRALTHALCRADISGGQADVNVVIAQVTDLVVHFQELFVAPDTKYKVTASQRAWTTEKVSFILELASQVKKMINEEIISKNFEVFCPRSGDVLDAETMKNHDEKRSSLQDKDGRVFCVIEMGLREVVCRADTEIPSPSQQGNVSAVDKLILLKAKVFPDFELEKFGK